MTCLLERQVGLRAGLEFPGSAFELLCVGQCARCGVTALTETLLAQEAHLNYMTGSHQIALTVKGALDWGVTWPQGPVPTLPLTSSVAS